jgi:hypothetical protein
MGVGNLLGNTPEGTGYVPVRGYKEGVVGAIGGATPGNATRFEEDDEESTDSGIKHDEATTPRPMSPTSEGPLLWITPQQMLELERLYGKEMMDRLKSFYRIRDPNIGVLPGDLLNSLSQDPIGFAAGDANLYRYVGNGPTNRTDPSGLDDVFSDYTAGRKELQRIYRRYAELYARDPDKYLWAGLATHAGSQVITEIYDRLQREREGACLHAAILRKHGSGSLLIGPEGVALARQKAELMRQMQEIILQMAKDIEADIGKQFDAYDSEGLAVIDNLIQGGMPPSIRGPWEKIDGGDYAGGSEGLTQREQTTVLNPGYDRINGLLTFSAIGIPMSWEAKSGLDKCPSFSNVSSGWFTDTRGPDSNARWRYIRDYVLKRWNSMTRQERDDWVKQQLEAVNSPGVRSH